MSGNETRDEFPYDEYSAPRRRVTQWLRRIPLARSLGVLIVLVLLYYGAGAAIINKIDADPDFVPQNVAECGSNAIAAAAALVSREVDENGWTANDPFFMPSAILD
ncbi:MAG: DUF2333 domain-containing protein, partial [Oceanibaculum sp.]|nr:DUF2333 domain-containing protein [Oceanibaculum sp.]